MVPAADPGAFRPPAGSALETPEFAPKSGHKRFMEYNSRAQSAPGNVAMPIYEYRCEDCGFQDEFLQKVSESPLTRCPACGRESLRKLLSAAGFQLKGSGWYATDFKHSGAKPAKASETQSDAKTDAKPKAEGASDAKAEAKAESKGEAAPAGDASPA